MVYHYNYFRIIYRLSDDKPEHIEAQRSYMYSVPVWHYALTKAKIEQL